MSKFTIHLLLKFGSHKNCLELLNDGKIYMNTVRYFQRLEKEAIGDKFEGVSNLINIPKGKITLMNHEKSIGPLVSKNIQIRENLKGSLGNIYSMYGITDSDIENKKEYRFPKYILNHWEYCVIIKDNKWFVDNIEKKLSEMGYKNYMQPVEYINMSKQNGRIGPFQKTDILQTQNEFRIYTPNPKEEVLEFNIGSLENRAIILSTKELTDKDTWIQLE